VSAICKKTNPLMAYLERGLKIKKWQKRNQPRKKQKENNFLAPFVKIVGIWFRQSF